MSEARTLLAVLIDEGHEHVKVSEQDARLEITCSRLELLFGENCGQVGGR